MTKLMYPLFEIQFIIIQFQQKLAWYNGNWFRALVLEMYWAYPIMRWEQVRMNRCFKQPQYKILKLGSSRLWKLRERQITFTEHLPNVLKHIVAFNANSLWERNAPLHFIGELLKLKKMSSEKLRDMPTALTDLDNWESPWYLPWWNCNICSRWKESSPQKREKRMDQ